VLMVHVPSCSLIHQQRTHCEPVVYGAISLLV